MCEGNDRASLHSCYIHYTGWTAIVSDVSRPVTQDLCQVGQLKFLVRKHFFLNSITFI